MKFLIDAQSPRRALGWLVATGNDAVHTLDLPAGNRTSDGDINIITDQTQRIVITKDADFVDSHALRGQPPNFCWSLPETSAAPSLKH